MNGTADERVRVTDARTVRTALDAGIDDAPAIGAPGRPYLDYAGLRAHVDRTVGCLNELGIGRGDRVGIVLPNGPEMASAFVSVAAGVTAAPLNPGYRRPEYDLYLKDLGVKALIVEAGSDSEAINSANALGAAVLRLHAPDDTSAGEFELIPEDGLGPEPCGTPGHAEPDDVALVLHTSGTTSHPKIVPLSNGNVCASAKNIQTTLRLTPRDRCLNVMPLFHVHGLMASVLSSLSTGASVVCPPAFNAVLFFSWLDEAEATWYSAVPAIHQAVLARAARNAESVERANLRFIRSSSSPLPPRLFAELEETLRVPVVEAYSMTEASHQMTSNQLPPGERRSGSVGCPAGPEVAIMDDDGNLLEPGGLGEIVVRGPNVTLGYEDDPDANRQTFTNGWFRTGDQGTMDEEGFLRLTGRLKEIINRGGEKISPSEIDAVLADHPAVQQAVTFAVPHEKLGEDVAAAVVLRKGAEASEREIRDFAAGRIAAFKVPRTVLFMDEIPNGPTGKPSRIGLAGRLGLGDEPGLPRGAS